MSHRRKLSILAGIVVTLLGTAAWAYFTTIGAGAGSAVVGNLNPPTSVTVPATVTGTTVTVSWTAPTPPASGTVDYYVQRFSGTTPTDACGTTTTSRITATNCNDTGVPSGTYTYKVTAYWRSWTAQSTASGSVTVTNDATLPTSSITFPSAAFYNTAGFNGGCSTPGICGTAIDPAPNSTGVNKVQVAIQRSSDSKYWNGTSFVTSASAIWNDGTTTNAWANWSYAFAASNLTDGTTYTVQSRATDNASNVQSPPSSKSFTYDTTPPSGGSISYTDGYYTTASVQVTFSAGTDSGSGVNTATAVLQRASATLSNGSCGSFGSFSTIATAPSSPRTDTSVSSGNCYKYQYVVSDNAGNTTTYTSANVARIDTVAPGNALSLTSQSGAGSYLFGTTLFYQGGPGGSFKIRNAVTDSVSGPASSTFGDFGGTSTGWTHTTPDVQTTPIGGPYDSNTFTFGPGTSSSPTVLVTGKDAAGNTTSVTLTFIRDNVPPAGGALTVNGTGASGAGTSSTNTTGSFTIGTRTDYTETQSATASGLASSTLVRTEATLTGSTCGSFSTPVTITGTPTQNAGAGVTNGHCYQYTLTGMDNVGNSTNITTIVKVDSTAPTAVDIQATDGSGTSGKIGSGDVITYTFSEAMDPNTIKSSWTGVSTSVNVSFVDTGDTFSVSGVNLGTVALGANYVKNDFTVTANMVMTGSTVTLTLTASPNAGSLGTIATSTMVWSPSSSAKDLAGNAMSTATATESGAPKQNF
jgi:hypothetical protein